jgi:peptide/nickel transport system substrate-binding protein
MKFPTKSQWKQIGKILKRKEKITLLVFFVLAAASFLILSLSFYFRNTKEVPSFGGSFIEGVVGQPRFINPIYGETNDVDRSLIDLIFSGLMTYDKNGEVVNDLIDSYKISENGKIYSFVLKNNIFWHDLKPLTTDDIVFTIKTIQNSGYKSPLRANWIDVDIEKTSEKTFDLKLKSAYNSFLENCTLKIIPKHIWENILPENFALSSYNLQPVGSGPYKFESLSQTNSGFIQSLDLSANRKYFKKVPYISNISFEFFENKDNLINSANKKRLNGFSLAPLDNNQLLAEKEINQGWIKEDMFSVHYFSLPRYFAIFFNSQKDKIFSDANIRKALVYSVDRTEIAKKIADSTKNTISAVNSPIIPAYFNLEDPETNYNFDQDSAKKLLDKSGFKDNGQGQREKPIKKTPAFQFKNYLSVKSKGTEVTELQKCLAKLGFSEDLKDETNGTYGKPTETAVTNFQIKYLPQEKPTGETGSKTRQKLNELCVTQPEQSIPLKFSITTINQPQLIETANTLKDFWQKIGAVVDIKAVEISELKTTIKSRDYDALLYGQALGQEPDLYPFWHSSQIKDPGLNFSAYENKDVDALLKDARENLNPAKKQESLEKIQNLILKDAPALFLYNPDLIYWASEKIKGINTTKIADPAKRFSNIQNWYIKTKRIWK